MRMSYWRLKNEDSVPDLEEKVGAWNMDETEWGNRSEGVLVRGGLLGH